MLRKKTSDKDPADWFAFAQERMHSVDVLWKSQGLTAFGIQGLQEAVERYLKGFLVAKGWALVKTHDLERLINEAARFDGQFSKFLPFAIELTEDFFAQHYPGDDTTNVGQNYDMLRQQAAELVAIIQQALPQYFSQPPTT
jgi:HEPN domain-containing protein